MASKRTCTEWTTHTEDLTGQTVTLWGVHTGNGTTYGTFTAEVLETHFIWGEARSIEVDHPQAGRLTVSTSYITHIS